MDTSNFKDSIMKIISRDEFSIVDLKNFLTPIALCVDSPIFAHNIAGIVNILISDRNKDHKFDIQDLQMLGSDIIGITSLTTSVLLVIGSIPQFKLVYDSGATEELVLKLLAYIFLVIIPQKTNQKWNLEEKESIVDLTILMYQLIKTSDMTRSLVSKIRKWFKSKKLCDCFTSKADAKEDVLEKRLPKTNMHLSHAISCSNNNIRLQQQITNLERRINQNHNL